MSTVTTKDWALVVRVVGRHSLLRMIVNFESQRSSSVSGMGGGTYYFPDGRRGWYQTTAKGVCADMEMSIASPHGKRGVDAEHFVPWSVIKQWAGEQAITHRAAVVELLKQWRDLYDEHPPLYPSIGRTYAWDRRPRGTDEEVERDRADLAKAQAENEVKREAWNLRKRELEQTMAAFVDGLAPTALDDMILATRAAS